jgi:lipoprotein signal peptidase
MAATLLGCAIAVAALDQASKFWALRNLPRTRLRGSSGVLRLQLVQGRGIALRGPAAAAVAIWVLTGALTIWLAIAGTFPSGALAAISLAFGGATSNLMDKLLHGSIVDFIIVLNRSAINPADVAIIGGVVVAGFALL